MLFKRGIVISREGWYYLFIVAFIIGGAVLREVNLLVVLAGMMVGPLIFNWRIVSLATRNVDVQRHLPRRICAGEILPVDLVATNRRPYMGIWSLVVRDVIVQEGQPAKTSAAKVSALIPNIPPSESSRTNYRCMLTKRGRYHFGPLQVSTRFPLGLVKSYRTIENSGELIVCPRVGHLTESWSAAIEAESSGSYEAHQQRGMIDGDYYGLREWRPGDSKRWIHWRTSAKLNQLIVREFERQRSREIALVIDLWQPDTPSEEQVGNVELALSFAATVIADTCRRNARRLAIGIAGESLYLCNAPASPVLVNELMEHMAFAKATSATPLAGAVEELVSELRHNSRLVIVSTRPQYLDQLLDDQEAASSRRVQHFIRSAMWIDVSNPQFENFFRID